MYYTIIAKKHFSSVDLFLTNCKIFAIPIYLLLSKGDFIKYVGSFKSNNGAEAVAKLVPPEDMI